MSLNAESRLLVLLFTDIVGSVSLKDRDGERVYCESLIHIERSVRAVIDQIEHASVLNDTGDGCLIAVPTAQAGVQCALDILERIDATDWSAMGCSDAVRVRIGVHMGEVTLLPDEHGSGRPKAVGLPVDITARIMDGAAPGTIRVSAPVYEDAEAHMRSTGDAERDVAWRSMGPQKFKGRSTPLTIYEVQSGGPHAIATPARHALRVLAVMLVLGGIAIGAVMLTAGEKPIRAPAITAIEVRRFAIEPEAGVIVDHGPISETNVPHVGDGVSVSAEYDAPAYCYLVSMDTDGQVVLRHPSDPDRAPERVTSFEFPATTHSADPVLFGLSIPAGAQAFALLVSGEPLPAWSAWCAENELPHWSPGEEANTVFTVANGADTPDSLDTKGALILIEGRIVSGPLQWLRNQRERLDDVRLVRFPVHETDE